MKVDFKQTNNHIHEIYINDKKAGLVCLLHCDLKRNISETEKDDWRVFFWGKYSQYQVSNEQMGMPNRKICEATTLKEVKEKITNILTTNPEQLLPEDKFIDKGHLLVHASNGEILSIDKEYCYNFTRHYHPFNTQILFSTEEHLLKVANEIKEKEEGKGFWYNSVLKFEFKPFTAMFDTSYRG